LAGERCDPSTLEWATDKLQIPVIDHWWQTETGWSICANCLGLETPNIVVGSPGKPVPGYQVQVLSDHGGKVKEGEIGSLVVKLPLPPGTFTTLWQADARYCEAYFGRFPGYYETGDAGYIDDNGNVFVMSRTDDVINVAGHRLSTGAFEEVLATHPDVAECAVVGIDDALKGQLPLGLLVLNAGVLKPHKEIEVEAIQLVRDAIGPIAAFKFCMVVNRLPKTRSGKILRATIKKIAEGKPWVIPATIDDAAILDEIEASIKNIT
jgi:propionyl-CoA synthetase